MKGVGNIPKAPAAFPIQVQNPLIQQIPVVKNNLIPAKNMIPS